MQKRDLNFFENYKLTVKFKFDNHDFTGVLSINQTGMPTLNIHVENYNFQFEDNRKIDYPITCHEIGSNNKFTLYQSELQRGGVIICKYVTTGFSALSDIDQVEIHLTGISTWFERLRSAEITEQEFKRDTHIEKFLVNFNHDKNDYSIENHRDVSSKALTSTDHHIKIRDCFIVKKEKGTFTLHEAENIALEIRTLFSLLLGHSLSVKYLYLFSSEKRYNYQSVIFPSAIYEEQPLDHYHQALCYFDSLFEWGLWEKVVTNYFSVKSFRKIWNRLVLSFSRSRFGIWEYGILSVVVTLEMYCEQESKGNGHKLDKENYKELKSNLNETLETFIKEHSFSAEDQLVLDGFKCALTNLRNTSHPTLQHKYDFLMAKTSDEIKETICFSHSDFDVLKKLRNSVAHGLNYNTVIEGEITKEVQLKDRLLTLLMYFVFHELGFDDNQIAQNLSHTHNLFILNAGGNERARDKLAGNARFITLYEEVELNDFTSFDNIVIDYEPRTKQFTLNKDLSFEVKNKWVGSGIANVRDFVKNNLSQDSNPKLEYIDKVYISSAKNEKCYYGAIVLTHK